MAAHKFLKLVSGVPTEEAAVATSAGAADEGKLPALGATGVLDSTIINSKTSSAGAGDAAKIPALDLTGKLDNSFLPSGIGADTSVVPATENLAAGDLVNLYIATTAKCRKADGSTAGKEADGFVLAAVTSGQDATVYPIGSNAQVTGLTPGKQWLSTTPGLCSATPPTGSGNVIQQVGFAHTASLLVFQRGDVYVLA